MLIGLSLIIITFVGCSACSGKCLRRVGTPPFQERSALSPFRLYGPCTCFLSEDSLTAPSLTTAAASLCLSKASPHHRLCKAQAEPALRSPCASHQYPRSLERRPCRSMKVFSDLIPKLSSSLRQDSIALPGSCFASSIMGMSGGTLLQWL